MRRFLALVLGVLVVGGIYLVFDSTARRLVMLPLVLITMEPEELLTPQAEGPDAEWFDGYFTITRIDDKTIAIGEPLYHSQNYNYLIMGDDRALLFDSGAGFHDIRPVVSSLTSLPVTAVASHIHFDHIGSHTLYENLAVIDLPYLRERAGARAHQLTYAEHLGFAESIPLPELRVTEWLAPGSWIDLGGRRLEVLHTPGHTVDSMALFDHERDQLFIGDFITEGPTFIFVPGASVGDELRTAETLLDRISDRTVLHTAHRFDPPGLPTLARSDVAALRDTLVRVRDGELEGGGFWPKEYPVNDGVWLLTDFEWAHQWD
jgi:hydroxyacylglutathione hydrolase